MTRVEWPMKNKRRGQRESELKKGYRDNDQKRRGESSGRREGRRKIKTKGKGETNAIWKTYTENKRRRKEAKVN